MLSEQYQKEPFELNSYCCWQGPLTKSPTARSMLSFTEEGEEKSPLLTCRDMSCAFQRAAAAPLTFPFSYKKDAQFSSSPPRIF